MKAKIYIVDGKEVTFKALSDEFGISPAALRGRWLGGCNTIKTLCRPIHGLKGNLNYVTEGEKLRDEAIEKRNMNEPWFRMIMKILGKTIKEWRDYKNGL